MNIIDKENKEVWNTFKQISKEPQQCLGAYVISMTSKASDILSVYFLQKQAEIKNLLRVVPLFETLEDLKNAKDIMESLFKLSWYRKLIKNKQEVMIGYSDSIKDADIHLYTNEKSIYKSFIPEFAYYMQHSYIFLPI